MDHNRDKFTIIEPYIMCQTDKEKMLTDELILLTEYHKERCPEYKSYLNAVDYKKENVKNLFDIPFFPVRIFKELDLVSVPKEDIIKTTTSSGTTGVSVSKMYIDRETAAFQQKMTVKQLTNYWGKKRLPFLIVDSEAIIKDRTRYSARAAGIMGLRFFSTDMVFCLDEEMNLDVSVLYSFLNKYGSGQFVIFGFTFMVWKHMYQELVKQKKTVDMKNGILMTGGGWKKFTDEGVSREFFKSELTRVCNIQRFMDHYGMAEQVGSIYLECEYGHYHASVFSDVIIRNYKDFSPCSIGEKGIIQVLSVAPGSYPGHSLLTEDLGVIEGVDDCPCGRKGKYIKVFGRIPHAEVRGCSDSYASKF